LEDLWIDALKPPYEGKEDAAQSPRDARRAGKGLRGLIRPDDYPAEAMRRNEQGSVTAQLAIDTEGRVTKCTIAVSSGSASLDSTTCRILARRARFSPAVDASGRPIDGNVSQRITWRLD
jgi:protein TonB